MAASLPFAAGIAAAFGGSALAEEPQPWQLGFQPPASPVMDQLNAFHNALLVIITLITLFVLVLLTYVLVRFHESRNPTPSRTTHNTLIEVLWTVVPVMILVGIAIPSFRLLYYSDSIRDADMTVKVIGHQWYWSYEYPDAGNMTFDSLIKADKDLQAGEPRLLATDTHLVLPVDTNISILVTSTDVIHSWSVPAFGIKKDAVPGRVNETWVRIERPGMYYGQCSQLCGVDHGYMPIDVEALSKDEFTKWLASAKAKYGVSSAPQAAPPSGTEAVGRLATVAAP